MMKVIFLSVFISVFSFACEGDCTVCHQKIVKKDGSLTKGHEGLQSCKTCHTPEKLAKIDMGDAACGQDCFECHDMKKITNSGVKQHEVLATCEKCHQIQKTVLELLKSPAKSPANTLQDFIK